MLEKHKNLKNPQSASPTGNKGASSLPQIGDSFMYIKTSNKFGQNVLVSFERTDIIQISNITFYYNRFSEGNRKSMGRLRIHLLLPDGHWHSKYIVDKKY